MIHVLTEFHGFGNANCSLLPTPWPTSLPQFIELASNVVKNLPCITRAIARKVSHLSTPPWLRIFQVTHEFANTVRSQVRVCLRFLLSLHTTNEISLVKMSVPIEQPHWIIKLTAISFHEMSLWFSPPVNQIAVSEYPYPYCTRRYWTKF